MIRCRKIRDKFLYSIEMSGFDFSMEKELLSWCTQTFGESALNNTDDEARWIIQWNGIRFKRKEDVTWFMIRWSN